MSLRDDLDAEDMKKLKGGRSREHSPEDLLQPLRTTTQESSITISSWAKSLGISRTTLCNYLPELRKRNYIQTTGEGTASRQFITSTGLTFLLNSP
jgi:hypothetical protein